MFDKLFGWGKKKELPTVDIPFGRYSDNNKPLPKVNRWTDADALFKEKKFPEGLDAFFDYLRDDTVQNVVYQRTASEGSFEIFQGSKIVRGKFNAGQLSAEVTLAKMPQASVPVMRRLLEMNFSLYYSRFALDQDRLCMRFDSQIDAASPNKLYYGLKELATRADKQDDLLVQDFTNLQTTDSDHITNLSLEEKEVKFTFLQKWIASTLETIGTLDQGKYSGGVAYLLLSLVYRIDYLITPEGKLLNDLEKIARIYFMKDERPVSDKNRDMVEEFRKLQATSREDIFGCLFRSKYTFSIVSPQPYKMIGDSIHAANQSMIPYRDNQFQDIACQISEFGISYCQYSYSLPKLISELFNLFMQVNYNDYFLALGYKERYYDEAKNQYNTTAIIERIKAIQEFWKEKYPAAEFRTANLRFDNKVNFNQTFTTELEFLKMEA